MKNLTSVSKIRRLVSWLFAKAKSWCQFLLKEDLSFWLFTKKKNYHWSPKKNRLAFFDIGP